MNRTLLLIALAAAVPARAADEFKPIKASESVTYPLPPIPLPAAPPADGKWAETEDSPALRVSRAWVKLGQAAGVERSEATRRLYQAWKAEVVKDGIDHGNKVSAEGYEQVLQGFDNAKKCVEDGNSQIEKWIKTA